MVQPQGVQAPRVNEVRLEDLRPGRLAEMAQLGYAEGQVFFQDEWVGDLRGISFVESLLEHTAVREADLGRLSLTESCVLRMNAPHLRAAGSVWRDVEIRESRFGVAEL